MSTITQASTASTASEITWATELSYASGVFFDQVSRNLPRYDDPRRKRTKRSSSDEVPVPQNDGLLEEDYRAGGPRLCELPAVKAIIPSTHPDANLIEQKRGSLILGIQAITRDSSLDVLEVDLVGRKARGSAWQPSLVTAMVTAHRPSPDERGWLGVARRILEYLVTEGLEATNVEIIDPCLESTPYVFPCYQSDPIYPYWERVACRILQRFELKDWVSLGCQRVGRINSQSLCPPTVVLSVSRTASHRHWKPVREGILRILDQYNLFTVGVLIRYDLETESQGSDSDLYMQASMCTTEAKVGYSLGLHDTTYGHGTFGGWLEIQNPTTQKWVPFGVTCAHCILPRKEDLAPNDIPILDKWRKTGIKPGDKDASRLLVVDSPGYLDMEGMEKYFNDCIGDIRDDKFFKQIEEAENAGDFIIPRDQKEYDILISVVQNFQRGKDRAEEYKYGEEYKLGTVFASSGLQEGLCKTTQNEGNYHSVLDWALIKPQAPRELGSNRLNTYSSESPISSWKGFLPSHREPDGRLFKVGRKTKFTTGFYNGLKEARVATQQTRTGEEQKVTWEHCVLGKGQEPFMAAGDSGSLVYTAAGQIAGLCFGGKTYEQVGYFTHIHDVLSHIHKMTGVTNFRVRGAENSEVQITE
ncbi:hypothetical protein BDV25DRAFT_140064 [Aspergillus avenaceus]|uniref:Uncharacterized protein n=1 Tax=Aspergillus avenaceus TaxID=36643 RepID=A0A5N6TVB5_ASPAV|nr:hypothetical protein BDV25DRAFT_140064 [Aspergillus avenaceus]